MALLRSALQRLLGFVASSREDQERKLSPTYSDDVLIDSYPKSGNTWVRFLIGNYRTKGSCSFQNLETLVPDIHTSDARFDRLDRPRFIKSHEPYTAWYPNVVYLVRDGRDVAVSYYYHLLREERIDTKLSFSDYLDGLLDARYGSFGRWDEHVHSWLDAAPSAFLLVKYEDLLDGAARELGRILDFAGVDVDTDRAAAAAEASAFGRMQRMEKEKEIPFVRSGTAGDWKEHFSDQDERRFIAEQGHALRRLGYLD